MPNEKTESESAGAVLPADERLTDERIEKAVFAVLRECNSDRLWKALTYDSGPYEITKAGSIVFLIARAIETEVRAAREAARADQPQTARLVAIPEADAQIKIEGGN